MGRPQDQLTGPPFRLFKVDMVSGDYDDGGAYWGGGCIYCLMDDSGNTQFARAANRSFAAHILGVGREHLLPSSRQLVQPLWKLVRKATAEDAGIFAAIPGKSREDILSRFSVFFGGSLEVTPFPLDEEPRNGWFPMPQEEKK